jgi:hypothetical protein
VTLTVTGHPTHRVFQEFVRLTGGSGPHDLLDRQMMDRGLMLVHGPDHVTFGDEPDDHAIWSDDRKPADTVLDQESNHVLQRRFGVDRNQGGGLTLE